MSLWQAAIARALTAAGIGISEHHAPPQFRYGTRQRRRRTKNSKGRRTYSFVHSLSDEGMGVFRCRQTGGLHIKKMRIKP